MIAFFIDFGAFLWDMRHWVWRVLSFAVVLTGLSIMFRMVDAENAQKTGMLSVSLGKLQTIDMFYGEINTPADYTANTLSGFVARPYKLVVYKDKNQDLVLTGVTLENVIWRVTVRVAGDGQTINRTQTSISEETSINVFLDPDHAKSEDTKTTLLILGLTAMTISFIVFQRRK